MRTIISLLLLLFIGLFAYQNQHLDHALKTAQSNTQNVQTQVNSVVTFKRLWIEGAQHNIAKLIRHPKLQNHITMQRKRKTIHFEAASLPLDAFSFFNNRLLNANVMITAYHVKRISTKSVSFSITLTIP
jgi:competence protein ComGC